MAFRKSQVDKIQNAHNDWLAAQMDTSENGKKVRARAASVEKRVIANASSHEKAAWYNRKD